MWVLQGECQSGLFACKPLISGFMWLSDHVFARVLQKKVTPRFTKAGYKKTRAPPLMYNLLRVRGRTALSCVTALARAK